MARKSAHDLAGSGFSWKEHFRDPLQWWEKRNRKVGPAYPLFIHKVTKESLWIDGLYNPSWVAEELRRRRSAQVHDEKDEGIAFVALLRACAKNKDLRRGTAIHDDILKRGLLEKCSDALVTMYAKCGAVAKAKKLFDAYKSRNVFTWNALMAGYAQKGQGQGQDALNCFDQMQREGLLPDAVTFIFILKACGTIGAVDRGERIHDEIAKQGLLGSNIVLGTALVDMYAKCGALKKAQQAFEELPFRDVMSWSALIAGYATHGEGERALKFFEQMQSEGFSPDAVTFTCILTACGSIGAAHKGEQIHDEIAKQGLLRNNIILGNALVSMYAKCGALTKAQRVLEDLPVRNVISWSALIAGYAIHGEGEQALHCYEQMRREGLLPDAVTFICISKACGSIGATSKGEQIHDEIAKQGLLGNNIVLGNALVDMYAKCGALAKARRLLEGLPVRDVISWSALIAGYAQQGECEQALNCFEQMQREGLCPNAVTFICILKACGSIGAADKGEYIHDEIAKQGLLGNDIVLGNSLVNMYAKCGALPKARQLLEELPVRDVFSWNALIAGYVQQGEGEQALDSFEQMQREGLCPDAATFSCVLTACSRLGLVEDAQMHFVNMGTKYDTKPELEHYTCMVDLFGRAGHLDKAVGMIQKMSSSDSGVWSALLGACRKWGDVNIGRWAFERAVHVDKSDGAVYVLMANIYAAAGMQEDAEIIEAMRIENNAWKEPTQSCWIDMCGNARSLFVEDTQHAQINHIDMKLQDVAYKMSQEGSLPRLNWVA